MDKPGVIVIGGHVQGLNITRIYGRNNIPVVLMDYNKPNLTRHSKYCREFIHYEKGELRNKLFELAESGRFKDWLLVPTNDGVVEFFNSMKAYMNFFKLYL